MLTLRSRAYVWPALFFLGSGFALANGLGYGDGNLRQYLLHALHALDPGFLAADWFTTQTRAHHVAFNALMVSVGRFLALDLFFGIANAVFALIFVGCTYLLAGRFYREPIVATTLAVGVWASGPTSLLGMSTIINSYFQPSTIGAVGLLVGLTCLVRERYGLAGWVFFVAALFHINYAVWIAVIVAGVLAICGRRIGLRRCLLLACPIVPAIAFHLPFVFAGRTPEQAASGAVAAHVLHDIYMPCHSRPLTWGVMPFVRFGAAAVAGVIAVAAVRPARPANQVTTAILGMLAAIFLIGTLLTAAIPVDTVALLFPFRLSPFLVLAGYIAVGGAVATTAISPVQSAWRTVVLWMVLGALLHVAGLSLYALSWLGAMAAAMLAGRIAKGGFGSGISVIIWPGVAGVVLHLIGAGPRALTLVALGIGAAVCWRWTQGRRWGDSRWTRILLSAAAAAPLIVGALLMRTGAARKDVLGPAPSGDEYLLYEWCRSRTQPDDVFIIPPLLAGFRLGAARAVVVDWKCMPILPRDTVEWYDRLVAECEVRFKGSTEAEDGFLGMNAARAVGLSAWYRARYLIVEPSRHRGDLSRLSCVYSNPSFRVFDLQP